MTARIEIAIAVDAHKVAGPPPYHVLRDGIIVARLPEREATLIADLLIMLRDVRPGERVAILRLTADKLADVMKPSGRANRKGEIISANVADGH